MGIVVGIFLFLLELDCAGLCFKASLFDNLSSSHAAFTSNWDYGSRENIVNWETGFSTMD